MREIEDLRATTCGLADEEDKVERGKCMIYGWG